MECMNLRLGSKDKHFLFVFEWVNNKTNYIKQIVRTRIFKKNKKIYFFFILREFKPIWGSTRWPLLIQKPGLEFSRVSELIIGAFFELAKVAELDQISIRDFNYTLIKGSLIKKTKLKRIHSRKKYTLWHPTNQWNIWPFREMNLKRLKEFIEPITGKGYFRMKIWDQTDFNIKLPQVIKGTFITFQI